MSEALYRACACEPPRPLDAWARDARRRTRALVDDLSDAELRVARLPTVNPLDWETAHAAYFVEWFVLRAMRGGPARIERADALFDSAAIAHDVRWDLDLPSRDEISAYLDAVLDDFVTFLSEPLSAEETYRALLSIFHEDMHGEAFAYTRQTMGYPAPELLPGSSASLPSGLASTSGGRLDGDARVPGGRFRLGAETDAGFVLDNEAWAELLSVAPFEIARAAVTQGEFAAFVDAGGYEAREHWTAEGWAWREAVAARAPIYWRRAGAGGWERRDFDRWVALEPDRAMIHVSAYEAEAFARSIGRRLPTELEWEVAAAAEPDATGKALAPRKRRYPWGDDPPTGRHVNMDGCAMGTIDVAALPDGDSAFGCRQMLGNVWEWTADTFAPYSGFEPGPYRDYSVPLFGRTRVLRGGAWPTRARMIRNTWRNYYGPERRDVWAGFRTCAR